MTQQNRETLLALADRAEKATGDSFDLNHAIALALGLPSEPFSASLDAAMSLVPEGWNWMAGNRDQPLARAYVNNGQPHFTGAAARRNPACLWFETTAPTPALALCAAALRARATLDLDGEKA